MEWKLERKHKIIIGVGAAVILFGAFSVYKGWWTAPKIGFNTGSDTKLSCAQLQANLADIQKRMQAANQNGQRVIYSQLKMIENNILSALQKKRCLGDAQVANK